MKEKDFELFWIKKIENELQNDFPTNYLENIKCDTLALNGKGLTLGPKFFGNYEILDVDGKLVLQTENYSKAKYILYANRKKPVLLFIPKDKGILKNIVKQYETRLDTILIEMNKEFKEKFPNSNNFNKISNHIFNALNLRRY